MWLVYTAPDPPVLKMRMAVKQFLDSQESPNHCTTGGAGLSAGSGVEERTYGDVTGDAGIGVKVADLHSTRCGSSLPAGSANAKSTLSE